MSKGKRSRLEVQWTESAVGDLEEAIAFVAAQNPEAAEARQDRVIDQTASLVRHAQRGPLVPELLRVGIRDYREVVVPPYRVVYKLEPPEVVVMAVVHGAREVEALLHRRLLRP